jgi:hypothetical protein
MTDDEPDAQFPSQSTVPAPVVEAIARQVTQLASLVSDFIQYQHDANENLTKRVERLERRRASRRQSSRSKPHF